MTQTLSAITQRGLDLLKKLSDANGELTPELEALVDVQETDLQLKVEGYASMLSRLDREEEFMRSQAEPFLRAARTCKRLEKKLRENLKRALELLQVDEIKGESIRFKLSATKQALILDESQIPDKYKLTVMTFVTDKERIRSDLELGVEIPGARLEKSVALRQYPCSKE